MKTYLKFLPELPTKFEHTRLRRHSNTISRSGSTPTPVLYNGAAGYQSDSATGLQLLGHRYYDPSIGRFLSSDPAQAGTNWYAYCDNNPLIGCDPTGLINVGRLVGDGLAGIAGGILGGPIGAAIAVGVFDGLYDYAGGDSVGGAIGDGLTQVGRDIGGTLSGLGRDLGHCF